MSAATTPAKRLQRALAVTALVVAVSVGTAFTSSEWTFAQGLAMARVSGWIAVVGMALGLGVRPLSRVSAWNGLSAWRRAIGVCTATSACTHVILSLAGPLDGAWSAVLTWPYLAAGALASVVLVLLLLTSFPRVIRLLRVRHWKVLHRAAYAAAAFVVAHIMLSPWGSVAVKGAAAAVLFVLLGGRLLNRIARR